MRRKHRSLSSEIRSWSDCGFTLLFETMQGGHVRKDMYTMLTLKRFPLLSSGRLGRLLLTLLLFSAERGILVGENSHAT